MTENTNSSANHSEDTGWGACPRGEISGMVGRISRQRRLRMATKTSLVAVMLLGVVGVWQFLPAQHDPTAKSDSELEAGSICCADVMSYAAAFRKGELDAEKTAQIRQHVAECPKCRQHVEKSDEDSRSAAGLNDDSPVGTPIAGVFVRLGW